MKPYLLTAALLSTVAAPALAAPQVAVDILPVHSLVSRVMDGVGEPTLVVPPGASPHGYAMRPSEAAAVQNADVVFFVGEELSPMFARSVESLATNAQKVPLLDVPNVVLLNYREGATFDAHDHGDHDDHDDHDEAAAHDDHDDDHDHDHGAEKAEAHDDHGHEEVAAADDDHDHDHGHGEEKAEAHDDHDHGHEETATADDDHDHDHGHGEEKAEAHDDHDHGHEETAAADDDHDHDHGHGEEKAEANDDHDHGHEETAAAHDDHGHDHHGHDHDGVDPHAWLDPMNAKVWVDAIAAALSQADPDNASTYFGNAAAAKGEYDALIAQVNDTVEPIRGRGYVVFHDAYHYFEERFDVEAAGAISLGDAAQPSPARVAEIKDAIGDMNAACVFAEPQFEPRLVDTVIEGTDASKGILDPLGADIPPGADFYPTLVQSIADNLVGCLKPAS